MTTLSHSRENAGLTDIIAACCYNGIRLHNHVHIR